jgi:ribose transport system ATP-binding protein
MRGIVKTFPGVRALDGVDLEVRAGEVHCLLGQNGAGKSTLIKVLSGAHRPDEGEIFWDGATVTLANPIAAMHLGIATIYQELDLVDSLTVAENIFLGHELSRGGFSQRLTARARARDLLERLGHGEIGVGQELGHMSAASQQIVSIARALSHDARLIVMDEPSAVLDQGEVQNLFRVIRDLTAEGVAVIYISHRLEEIRDVGDRATVLKDGRTVGTDLPAKETPTADIIRLMTGRTVEYAFPPRPGDSDDLDQPASEPVLRVRGLTRRGEFGDVNIDVRAGEVVGLAGLVGSGRSEVLETVFGARKPTAGTVEVHGKRLRPGSVRSAVNAGVGMAPEERKRQALLMTQSVVSNLTIASLEDFARAGFVRREGEREAAAKQVSDLDIRPSDPERVVQTLSGGNQQKVVLGRWLMKGCDVLLLDEPTRGVDVGARSEIYRLIRRLADDGVAVLLVSSEIPEVLGLADRVLVMREGAAVHEGPAEDIDEHQVLDLVMEGSAA